MKQLKVLIIEDSESDAALILRSLRKGDFDVISHRVEEAEELSSALSSNKWDVILADYQLPQFNANKALEILKETGLDIPFIVISGAIGEETAVELMKAGACDFMNKGNLARLVPAIKREIAEAKNRQERLKAYESLKTSERNLQSSQRAAHVGHWVFYPLLKKLDFSDELIRIFGNEPDELDADLLDFSKKYIHPDDYHLILEEYETKEFASFTSEIEFRIIRPDQSIRYVISIPGELQRDTEGRIVQISGVIQDITERKQTEHTLRQKIEESLRRAQELEMISDVSSSLRLAQNRPQLIQIFLEKFNQIMKTSFSTLGLITSDHLVFENAIGELELKENLSVSINAPFFAEVIRQGKSVFISHTDAHLLPKWITHHSACSKSYQIFPLMSGSNVIGVILLCSPAPEGITGDQINLVIALSDIIGNAINRMLASEELVKILDRREKELEHIYRITSAASSTLDLDHSMRMALDLTLQAVRADCGIIFMIEHQKTEVVVNIGFDKYLNKDESYAHLPLSLVNEVVHAGKTIIRSDCIDDSDKHCHSWIGLPMHHQERLVGVLLLGKPNNVRFIMEELTLLSFIADHFAVIIENNRLYQKAETAAILEERTRLARELHDSVTQLLYSANLYSAGALRFADQENFENVRGYLPRIGELTQQALKEMRLLVYELRTTTLVKNGLIGAIENRLDAVERRSGIQAGITASSIPGLPTHIEENLYRVVMEALNNSLKHAGATEISIDMNFAKDDLTIQISDNGCGFEIEQSMISGGMGLLTMKERIKFLDGEMEIISQQSAGTKIMISAPVNVV